MISEGADNYHEDIVKLLLERGGAILTEEDYKI